MPPHILLQSTDEMKGDPRLKPAAFHPASKLPGTVPDGAHRVIKETTAHTMREMMRGIVIEGTGKAAALNGYSSGGKTGTAQKIDVVTHTYSHTKLVASFAGMAPVENPAITVAVVIDTPTVGSLYGAAVSAPVFAEVAQEVLEYLGVPHDQPLKTKKEMQIATANAEQEVDGAGEDKGADLQAMFAEVNDLPADDPLRTPPTPAGEPVAEVAEIRSEKKPASKVAAIEGLLSAKVLEAFHARGSTSSVIAGTDTDKPVEAPKLTPVALPHGNGVVVDAGQRVPVPGFVGAPLRTVVERAGTAGLRVQPVGSGLATQQVPLPGTMVPVGTEVVVRFAR